MLSIDAGSIPRMDRFDLNFVHAVRTVWETAPTKQVFESPIESLGKPLICSFGNACKSSDDIDQVVILWYSLSVQ
jgi:hypothetical protein